MKITITLHCPDCQRAKIKKTVRRPTANRKILLAVLDTVSEELLEKPAVFLRSCSINRKLVDWLSFISITDRYEQTAYFVKRHLLL
jgi:hypothetical protein